MAGSINLSLSQQFDITNGRLLSGGKLYFYSAGTSTPQNVYRDQALTLAHTNPIILASDGRIPQFYAADGSIRARLTNRSGVVQFDSDNILVVGPSSGAGGGSSVDATTIFQTGDVIWLDQSGSRAGWVRDNGRTIGSGSSGASERANSDCQILFEFLWATYSNTVCPVSTGRGSSAAVDWAANKTITLPDKRGYLPGGLSDMGSTDSGRFASVPVIQGAVTTAGSQIGEALNTLTIPQLPVVTPAGSISGGPYDKTTANTTAEAGVARAVTDANTVSRSNPTFTGTPFGGGGAHNNTPLTVLGTFYRKL